MEKTDEYIKDRIQWKAKGYLPLKQTGFWEDAPSFLVDVGKTISTPCLFSYKDHTSGTILGIREILTFESDTIQTLNLIVIKGIDPRPIQHNYHRDRLTLVALNGDRVEIRTEAGIGCFCIWNALLTACSLNS